MHILNASHRCTGCNAGWLPRSTECWRCGGESTSFVMDTRHEDDIHGSLTLVVSRKPSGEEAERFSGDLEKLMEVLAALYP